MSSINRMFSLIVIETVRSKNELFGAVVLRNFGHWPCISLKCKENVFKFIFFSKIHGLTEIKYNIRINTNFPPRFTLFSTRNWTVKVLT